MAKQKAFIVAAFALLAGAAWIVYGRALDAPFVFDDSVSVGKNTSIRKLWPLFGEEDLSGPLSPPNNAPTSGRPLVNLSLAINFSWGAFNPVGYHLFNLILHVLSAGLLMAIVRRTLSLEYFQGRFERASGWLAFAAALLWVVHPLQTETVLYVTQRTELMVGFFYLATLYASLRYWGTTSAIRRNAWLAVATLACLAGMACKEVMVTAPVLVLLFERTFIRGSFWQSLRKSWPLYVGLFLSWGLLYYLNRDAPRSESAGFHLGIPQYVWWLTQTKVLLMYLKLAFWPWPLAIHYELPYFTTLGEAWLWVGLAALLAMAALILLWRRSASGFVGACVLLILSPTLVVPIVTEVAAERRMYLPLAALAPLVVAGGYWLLERSVSPPASGAAKRKPNRQWIAATIGTVAVLLAVVLSGISIRRLDAYHDDLTIWRDTVIQQPGDYLAHNNLGKALSESGQLQEAIAQYLESIRLNPNYFPAHNNLGATLNEAGRWPEAIPQFETALRLKPDFAEAHNNLGVALAATNRYREAIAEYEQALRLEHDYPDAHFNLSLALRYIGKPQEAAEHCLETLRLNPNAANAWANLAMSYEELNRMGEAVAAAQKAFDLAQAQGQTVLAERLSEWLKAHRPAEANGAGTTPRSQNSAHNYWSLGANFVQASPGRRWPSLSRLVAM